MSKELDDLFEEYKKNNPEKMKREDETNEEFQSRHITQDLCNRADEIFMRDKKSIASNIFDKMNSSINWFRLVHNKEPKLIILNSDLFSLCMYELSKTANIDLTEKTLHFKGVEVRPTIKKEFFMDVF